MRLPPQTPSSSQLQNTPAKPDEDNAAISESSASRSAATPSASDKEVERPRRSLTAEMADRIGLGSFRTSAPRAVEPLPGAEATAKDLHQWLDDNFWTFSHDNVMVNSASYSQDVYQWAPLTFPTLRNFAALFAHPAANDSHKDAFVDKVREYRGKRMLSVEMLADLVNRMPAHAGSTLEEYKRSQTLFNRMPFEELVGTERKERIFAPLP